MLLQIWTLYLDSLVTNPLLTKCITSAVGFIVGDSLAQLITAQPYSSLRTLRFAVIGFTLHAPVADTWFRFLEKVWYHPCLLCPVSLFVWMHSCLLCITYIGY